MTRSLIGETLCESGRCIDAFKKRRRVLKKRGRVLQKRGRVLQKRGRVLKKVCLVRETGDGPLLQKGGGWLLKKGGMVLKNPVEDHWRSLRSSTPSRRPSLCLPDLRCCLAHLPEVKQFVCLCPAILD